MQVKIRDPQLNRLRNLGGMENAKRCCHLLLSNFRLLGMAKMPKEFVTLLTSKG
jgi:hypothetical protein